MKPPAAANHIYRRVLLLVFFLAALVVFILAFPMISDLLVMLIIAVILTYILKPGVAYLEHMGINRVLAIASIFVVTTLLIIICLRFFIPMLIDEGVNLVASLKEVDFVQKYTNFITWVDERLPGLTGGVGLTPDRAEMWLGRISSTITAFLQQSTKVLAGAANIIVLASIVPMLIFFFLKDGSLFTKKLIEKVPNRFFEMSISLAYRIDQQLGNYIRSVLLESVIIAIMTWIALEILGVKFAILLGLLNGLLNSIPFFGPIIAYLPIGFVILITYNPPLIGLFWMAIILLSVQVIDNILAKPLLIGRSVDVHPAMVLLVVLIGGRLAGAIGMFIAVPAYKIIQVIIVGSYNHLKQYRII